MHKPKCATPDCDRVRHARSLCKACYGRLLRSGTIQPMLPIGSHSLSNVDTSAATADCAVCGPVSIRMRAGRGGNECWNARRIARTSEVRFRTRLKSEYGITPEHLADMTALQDGLCAICQQVPDNGLVVDHDHDSGRVRGLLCNPCNLALGLLRDDPGRLAAAIEYLATAAQLTPVRGA